MIDKILKFIKKEQGRISDEVKRMTTTPLIDIEDARKRAERLDFLSGEQRILVRLLKVMDRNRKKI